MGDFGGSEVEVEAVDKEEVETLKLIGMRDLRDRVWE